MNVIVDFTQELFVLPALHLKVDDFPRDDEQADRETRPERPHHEPPRLPDLV